MTQTETAWSKASFYQMQSFARDDRCLDMMVPSDLREIITRSYTLGGEECIDKAVYEARQLYWAGMVVGAGAMSMLAGFVYFIVERFN